MTTNATVDIDNDPIEQPLSQNTGNAAQHLFPNHHPGLTLQDLRRMLRNEPVGIAVISSRGWIIATIIAMAKFLAGLTGSELVVHSWENAPPQEPQADWGSGSAPPENGRHYPGESVGHSRENASPQEPQTDCGSGPVPNVGYDRECP